MENRQTNPTMVTYSSGHIPSIEELSAKKLASLTIRELIKKTYHASIAIYPAVAKAIAQKLATQAILDEFRDHGTIENTPIDQLFGIQKIDPTTNNTILSAQGVNKIVNYIKKEMNFLTSPYINVQVLRGHIKSVTSAVFSPDGTKIVTTSLDNTARVWTQNDQGIWESQVLKRHTNWVNTAAFSPDSTKIVTASWDTTVSSLDSK